ncbi:unnamed protein product [Caenorhabditis auriculariae]|uniref:Uncharacterized protein n=1 Tax=Caenorhabditis auriculariae TaxID=2777116 RepID=A0A8S1I0S7_9PELO|nr:unnamed protein product [Caenorhabditis auriculariae]
MLSHEEVPHLLKRSHVVSGYRPLHQPHHFYLRSAFEPHNEVLNVWTHFLPAVALVVFYLLPEMMSEAPRPPVLVLHSGIAFLLLCSSFAHLLHSRSPLDHIFWFLIDFSGIALFGVSIGLQRFSCSDDMGFFMRITYLPLLLLVVLGLQYFSTCYLFVFKPTWERRLELRMASCFFLACWLYIPLYSRYTGATDDEADTLRLHSRAFQWLLVSGVFMGAQVPERFAPGVFDIVGYGHQLFHLCINMVAWNLVEAAERDCKTVDDGWRAPANVAIGVSFGLTFVAIVANMVFMMRRAIKNKYE